MIQGVLILQLPEPRDGYTWIVWRHGSLFQQCARMLWHHQRVQLEIEQETLASVQAIDILYMSNRGIQSRNEILGL